MEVLMCVWKRWDMALRQTILTDTYSGKTIVVKMPSGYVRYWHDLKSFNGIVFRNNYSRCLDWLSD